MSGAFYFDIYFARLDNGDITESKEGDCEWVTI